MGCTQLEAIYRTHRQGFYTLALAITRSTASAEDAVQEAFTRLCRIPETQLSPAYAFAAVRNAARDQLRRLRRVQEIPDSLFDNTPRPDESAETFESARLVESALAALETDDREVIVMKVYAQLTFDQIAQSTGEPLQTIASRYRRAMIKLKERLGAKV